MGRDLVKDLGLGRERLEPMGDALGHINHVTVIRRQFESRPIAVGRGIFSHVDDDVEQSTPGTTHQLGLHVRRRLKVNAAQCPCQCIEGRRTLDQCRVQAAGFKFVLAPRPGEISPPIAYRFRFDEMCPRDGCFLEYHGRSLLRPPIIRRSEPPEWGSRIFRPNRGSQPFA